MNISQIEANIKYITNAAGEKTEVIVPVHLWEFLLGVLKHPESGLSLIDENEDTTSILADLKQSIKQASQGQTYPASDLWTDGEE